MSPQDLLVILPEIIITVSALSILILDLFLSDEFKRSLAGFSILGIVLALAANLVIEPTSDIYLQGMIRFDSVAQFLNVIFLVGAGLACFLSADYVVRQGIAKGEYYALILLSTLGAMLMGSSNDLIMLFLGLEALSIPLYILAAFVRKQAGSQESGLKYFLLGSFASAFFLYGIAMLYGATGTTQLSLIATGLENALTIMPLYIYAGAGLILVGLAFKASVVPFHMWAPDVYEGAPTSATGFMAVAAKAAAFAALIRVFGFGLAGYNPESDVLMGFAEFVTIAVGIMAILTMIYGNVVAIVQTNLKRLLAYSSIAHAGYLLLAIAAMPTQMSAAIDGLLLYLLIYSLMTVGAFGVVIVAEGKGENLSLSDVAGYAVKHPWIAGAMAIFMVSLAGIPPTAGFFGKLFVFRAAIDAGQIGLALVGVLASVVSVYYYLRVVYYMYMQPESVERPAYISGFVVLGIGIAAISMIALGILPAIATDWLPNLQAPSTTLP